MAVRFWELLHPLLMKHFSGTQIFSSQNPFFLYTLKKEKEKRPLSLEAADYSGVVAGETQYVLLELFVGGEGEGLFINLTQLRPQIIGHHKKSNGKTEKKHRHTPAH